MPRPSMSAKTIANNKIRIIDAAIEMIRENGIQSVTARSLGSRINMNSALLYRYFKDIDEVILFACVHVLQEYTREMTDAHRAYEESDDEISNEYIYMLSWELFCKHAFSNPEEFNTLFFSKHSEELGKTISEYYDLFPPDRNAEDDIVLEVMYRTADLSNRNLMVLTPVLKGRKTEKEIKIINEMTISYFYTLLIQMTADHQDVTAETQASRMLDACRYITEL